MKIIICDINRFFVEELVSFCHDYFKKMKIDVEIEGTTDPERIESNLPDILIVDINMPRRNGIDIKKSLERYINGPLIIFTTNPGGLIKEAIGKNVIGLLEKPIDRYQMSALLKKAIELVQKNSLIEITNGKYCFCNEIMYITVEKIYTDVYLTNERIETNIRKPMKDWEAQLIPYDFMRISDSCMVNFSYVEEFTSDKVKLKHIAKLFPISRRRKAECKEKYYSYCRRIASYL